LTLSSTSSAAALYQEHVNPQWARLLTVLDMNVRYKHCQGSELFTEDGRRILDFLSGYCVHNAGHNHPGIIQAIKDELDANGPAMVQSHAPDLAGELAAKLCKLAGGRLKKVYFCCSATEGIEAAIKFSRASSGRDGLLYAGGASHGLTCGALSLMSNPFWREGFGALLPSTEEVAFGDLIALETKLATRKFGAFSSSRCRLRAESGRRRADIWRPLSNCAAAMARSWSLMKRKPACTVRDRFSPRIITRSSPMSSCWRKR